MTLDVQCGQRGWGRLSLAAVVGGDNDNNTTISHKRGGGEEEGYGSCKGKGSQASKAGGV